MAGLETIFVDECRVDTSSKGSLQRHQDERLDFPPLIRDPDFLKGFPSSLERTREKDSSAEDGYVALSFGVAAFVVENVVCHPLLVLRRTCQVSPSGSSHFHCVPFQMFPVSIHLYHRQGISAFYKGLSGCLTLRGLQMGAEDLTSKLTPWPKELDRGCRMSLRKIGQHLLLKAAALAVTTPFYSASLVETVQSDIACEKPGILDIFREGFCRLAPGFAGARLLPVWLLIPPTVAHGIAHYAVTSLVAMIAFQLAMAHHRRTQERNGGISRRPDESTEGHVQQTSNAIGSLVADVLLYPVETVLNRLHLQGSRTLIDDLDSGVEVVPVLTRYEGVVDCFETIRAEEGICGFYRGFGALILQYAIRLAALHSCSVVAKEVVNAVFSSDTTPSPHPASQSILTPSEPTQRNKIK